MRVIALFLCLAAVSPAYADKIAVIDVDRLYQKGGIAKWLAARAKLDEDRKKFRVVENPGGGKRVDFGPCDPKLMGEDYCKRMKRLETDMTESRAWAEVERSVLDPIETEVTAALQAFATARRIDVLFQREEMMLYVSPGADITDAFIKDFNTKPAPKAPAPKR